MRGRVHYMFQWFRFTGPRVMALALGFDHVSTPLIPSWPPVPRHPTHPILATCSPPPYSSHPGHLFPATPLIPSWPPVPRHPTHPILATCSLPPHLPP